MDITRYAHERWHWGARDETDVAVAYIRLALGQKDPEQTLQMLLPAVRGAVSEAFRVERLKVEEHVPWDDLLSNEDTETRGATADPHGGTKPKDRTNPPRPKVQTRTTEAAHSPSTLDAINDLLKTHLWVWRTNENGRPAGGMIPWSELTLDDITPTIEHERNVITGHERRISRLEKAKALMEQHGVTVFGDIPFSAEVKEVVLA